MQLVGDPEGVAALKELAQNSREFLKFLITEAQTSLNHTAPFTGTDGTKWQLVLKPGSSDLEVQRAP
ncbi:MAG TPA: hypothetical protein VMZ28_08695 [Kofleriaceae bacterium]|nr:hypothetical protein [Kofleriaceae bacterium]